MNAYSLILLIVLLVHVAAMAYLAGRDLRPPAHRATVRFGLAVAAWLVGDIIAGTAQGPIPWPVDHLVSLAWFPIGLLYVDLAYKLVGRKVDWIWWLIAAAVAGGVVLNFSTDLVTHGYGEYWFGRNELTGPLYVPVLTAAIVVPWTWGMVVVARVARRDPQRRDSLLLFLAGTGPAVTIGAISDIVIPDILGYEAFPPLAASTTFLVNAWIVLVLVRQGTLVLNLESAARDLFEHLADGVLVVDLAGEVRLHNQSAALLLGAAIPLATPLASILHDCPMADEVLDHETRTRGTAPRVVSLSRSPVRAPDGRILGHVVVLRDLTRRQEAQAEMAKRQRLESLGVLAGGIAHDFNNALLAILGNTSLLQAATPPTSPESTIIAEVEEAASRARQLTQQLLAFSKGGAPILRPVRLEDVLDQATRLSLGGSRVSWELSWEPRLQHALADEGQLVQVFNNLFLNARDAGASQVRIRAEQVKGEPTGLALTDAPYVCVEVRDDGPGIPEHALDRIFDPYFTTKDKGSGLGLASVYTIVQRHGGLVRAGNAPGGGAVFEVYLPLTDQQPAPSSPPPARRVASPGLRILVMDDDAAVRRVSARLLRRYGYTVDTAEHGDRAMEMYLQARARGTPYRVVILDLTVAGGMGGVETVAALLEVEPGLRAVVSSGYSDDPVMASPLEYGFCAVLAKPYTPAALVEAVEIAGGTSAEG